MANRLNRNVSVVDLTKDSVVQGIAVSPDGTRLYVAAHSSSTSAPTPGYLVVWNLEDGTKLTEVSLDFEYGGGFRYGGGFGLALSPDGIWLAVSVPTPGHRVDRVPETGGLHVIEQSDAHTSGQ